MWETVPLFGVIMAVFVIALVIDNAIENWRTRRAARYLGIDVPSVKRVHELRRDIRRVARAERRRERQRSTTAGTRRWELRNGRPHDSR